MTRLYLAARQPHCYVARAVIPGDCTQRGTGVRQSTADGVDRYRRRVRAHELLGLTGDVTA